MWGDMTRLARVLLLMGCLVLLLFLVGSSPSEGPIVWVVGSLERVGLEANPKSAVSIDLYAARGEYESFQIIVRAPASGLKNVNVRAPDLGGPRSTLYREKYVRLTRGTKDWTGNRNKPLGPGWYPDALIPFENPATGERLSGAPLTAAPFDLDGGRNQPIWVDVFVPRTTPAGLYRGDFLVTSDQGRAKATLNLKVWDFNLPLRPSLRSCILYWKVRRQLPANQELLRHRLMPISVDPGQERLLIDTLGLSCTHLGFWSKGDQQRGAMDPAPSVAELRRAVAQHQRDLYLYNYTADEVEGHHGLYESLRQWAQNLHQAGVDNLVTMAPVPELYDDGSGTGRSAVDVWTVLPKMYDRSRARIAEVLQKGDKVWSYNALVQDDYSPKWLIDFAPINFRIQPGFLSQSLRLSGLLYWRADLWSSDPWSNVEAYRPSYPGEGMLVYPGEEVGVPGVVGSMRLKWIRDGVEDFDYLQILNSRGLGEQAMSIARSVGRDWQTWTRDPDRLETARHRLGEMIEATPTRAAKDP